MKIEDYGFIGNMRTAALVGCDGSIDWLCLPRFDSNACMAALLGDESNGCWRIAPRDHKEPGRQRYWPDTLILETEFETPTGVARVIDFMPPHAKYREVIRVVEGVRGSVDMQMRLILRFDYGRTVPWMWKDAEGLNAVAGPDALNLRTAVPTHGENLSTMADFTVTEGERACFTLTWHPSHEMPPESIDPLRALNHTDLYWREWCARCSYRGEWREAVMRSLLTLKALTFAPTGGIMAAATTSLPEQLGGVRNWDYRFCWIRDATFTLFSLMEAGYTEEAKDWSLWLLRAVAGDPSQLQIMYGAAGERGLPEIELKHLKGYEGSRPVRIGNAASEQFQLDVYGELMDAMHLARQVGLRTGANSWRLQRHVLEFVERHWTEPDEGIWEIRGPRRHFTHSKVMAWVAADRAVKAVEEFNLEGDVERWRALRQAIFDDVCAHGYNAQRGCFTQHYDSEQIDASLLMIPLVGFLPATDPRVAGTIRAIQRELTFDGFVYRYHPTESGAVDGLPPGEGAFLPCTFWLVDCLHLMGETQQARKLFHRLLDLRNGLGLLAEEFDPRHGRLVGNFPQAFSHVALINTAQNLAPDVLGPAEIRGSTTAPPL
ncbi:glycoside hydrolase family 15 protein [Opitutus sp. ER46]|uniref:glycoside hydrolase family 15 protein n=1 Tax=Opitutus sp. ER46 TaxID=2161864 RepID=UPI0018EE68D2|nr:glycoside hydrolase family 15 protein [Opitutus sp. ER46]